MTALAGSPFLARSTRDRGYPLDDLEVVEKEISRAASRCLSAIGRQRAREGHSHVTAGRVIVVVSPEGGCEEGSWKEEDGLDLFFRTDGKSGRRDEEERRRDGDVTVGPHGESANSSFVEPPMTTSSPRRFLAGWAQQRSL